MAPFPPNGSLLTYIMMLFDLTMKLLWFDLLCNETFPTAWVLWLEKPIPWAVFLSTALEKAFRFQKPVPRALVLAKYADIKHLDAKDEMCFRIK